MGWGPSEANARDCEGDVSQQAHRELRDQDRPGSRRSLLVGSPYDSALEAARMGEEWAWRSLYEWISPRLLGYATARGASDPEAVLGDVWVEAASRIGLFRGDARGFRRWLFVIAHSRIVDDARRYRRRLVVQISDQELVDLAPSAEAIGLARLGLDELLDVMSDLTDLMRETLLLRTVADLSLADTAEVLAVSVGAVKSAQYHAVVTLKRILKADATKSGSRSVTEA